MLVYCVTVFLASNEWGNDLMQKVAEEVFGDPQYADKQPLVVLVNEHAGWFLNYALIDGVVTTIGSANDSAVYTGAKQQFREKIRGAKWEHLPTIRREPQN